MKTPNLAPQITDKALRTHIQFLTDDLKSIESKISPQKTDIVNFTITSGAEFNIGSCYGGCVINSNGADIMSVRTRNTTSGCLMTVVFGVDLIGQNIVVARWLK